MGKSSRFHFLVYFLNDFLRIKEYIQEKGWRDLPYFFHAGETTWNFADQQNLFDAVLLNTTRIGHGFALRDYEFLQEKVRSKGIAIEVCPISNQMLRLVDDQREHPALSFMNNGLPVTISSDDPIIYGYFGTSYDFYIGLTAWNLTLADLKQLVNNSLTYSTLNQSELTEYYQLLQKQWDDWITWVLSQLTSTQTSKLSKDSSLVLQTIR